MLSAVAYQVEAVPILNPNNNHYYDVVSDPLTWTQARQDAELQVNNGLY